MFFVEMFQKRTNLLWSEWGRTEKSPPVAHPLDRRPPQAESFYQISYFARIWLGVLRRSVSMGSVPHTRLNA